MPNTTTCCFSWTQSSACPGWPSPAGPGPHCEGHSLPSAWVACVRHCLPLVWVASFSVVGFFACCCCCCGLVTSEEEPAPWWFRPRSPRALLPRSNILLELRRDDFLLFAPTVDMRLWDCSPSVRGTSAGTSSCGGQSFPPGMSQRKRSGGRKACAAKYLQSFL